MKSLSDCRVLLVDDTKTNIDVLVNGLKDEYKLSIALNGPAALASVKANPPDLILLDIMMPDMSGYEVIMRLKADAQDCEIPVIFITAMDAEEDETRGLQLGAVDYIRKPFSLPIVKARLRTHLALRLARLELQSQNDVLREAARLREDVERMSRHDIKTPLTSVISAPSLLRMMGTVNEKQEKILELLLRAGYRMLEMINRSLDLYKMEIGTYKLDSKPVELIAVIRQIIQEVHPMIEMGAVQIEMYKDGWELKPQDTLMVTGDEMICYSLFCNLIKNAIEASPPRGVIKISFESGSPSQIRIQNEGTVPEALRDRFFEKYATHGKKQGTGLGTYSAKLMAKIQGGEIQMTTNEKEGTTLIVDLP